MASVVVRLWLASCITSLRHSKLPAMALGSLKDKFSLGSTARSPKEDVMKRNLIGTLSLVALSLLGATGSYAQPVAKADVPFAFAVGTKQLPAGCYQVISDTMAHAIQIRNCDGSESALSLARRESTREAGAKLVFHRVGSQYFLRQVKAAETAMILPPSKQEKELLLANSSPKDNEEIVIAMK
jgi:hypothetical protein